MVSRRFCGVLGKWWGTLGGNPQKMFFYSFWNALSNIIAKKGNVGWILNPRVFLWSRYYVLYFFNLILYNSLHLGGDCYPEKYLKFFFLDLSHVAPFAHVQRMVINNLWRYPQSPRPPCKFHRLHFLTSCNRFWDEICLKFYY